MIGVAGILAGVAGLLLYATFQNVAALSRDVAAIKAHLDKALPVPGDEE
jgi:hypothetical protein